MNIKGKGQRLIPEELLKYLEALKNKYPDAVDLVEANPTLEGGEDSLSSVLINGTKYAVGGGSDIHLYQHHLFYYQNSSTNIGITLYSSSNEPMNYTDIVNFLVAEGYVDYNYKGYADVTGKWGGTSMKDYLIAEISTSSGTIYGETLSGTFSIPNTVVFTDTIRQIF